MTDKKASLFYFTGTGNSLRALSVVKEVLEKNGYLISIDRIGNKPAVGTDSGLYGFSFPVYSLALPRIALKFMKNLPEVPAGTVKKAFLFMTGGASDDAGWSLVEGKKILEDKGYHVVCTELFMMPNNWLPFDEVPSPEEAKTILENAEARIRETTKAILQGEERHKPLNVKKFGYLPSLFMYFIFRNLGVKRIWKFFKANGNCNSCEKCAKACPTRSITMKDGKPSWSKTCEQCMRCIHLCPQKAVEQLEFIGKGSGRNRYFEPHFKPLTD